MICVILAAGYATRLYPLTENFPKPLLQVKDKTILDWLIDDIAGTGKVDSYVIISNHKFYNHFLQWKKGKNLPITVLDDGTTSNENRLGAVKDVQFAIDTLNLNDDLLVIAGDNVLDFSFNSFINYFNSKEASCVMRYYEKDINKLRKCGVLKVDDSDLIIDMVEKPQNPESNWAVPPFYIYHRNDIAKVHEGIVSGCGTDAPGSFIAWLCQRSPVYAMIMPGNRYDIGDLTSYKEVQDTYGGINEQ